MDGKAREEYRLLDSIGHAVIVTDAGGSITFWSTQAERLFGWCAAEVLGEQVLDVTPATAVLPAAGEIMESLSRGEAWTGEMLLRRKDGSTFIAKVTDAPVLDDEGRIVGIVGVSEDVSARKRSEEARERLLAAEAAAHAAAEASRARMQFLAEATEVLNESLDLDHRLDLLARLPVPRLCDVCVVHLVDHDGEARPRAIHHRDPERAEQIRELLERFPVRLDAPSGLGVVIRDGRVLWVPEATEDVLRSVAHDEQHLAMLRALQPTSGVAIPLRGRSGVLGAVTLATVGTRRLSDEDRQLAEALCDRAGVAVENALLLAARERIEQEISFQAALLTSLNDAAADGILVVSPEGAVLSYNQRFVDLWRFEPELVAALSDDSLLDAALSRVADPDGFIRRVRALYADPSGPARDEVVLRDGTILDRYGAPLRSPEGEYHGWAWYFRDITAERWQQAELVAARERFATLARTLQQSLLPPALPEVPGVELAARYHPAYEGLDVGGDFYDAFPVEGGWMLVLGDVCGKGAEAAVLTALVRYTIRAAAMHAADLPGMLAEVNATMLAHQPDPMARRFATVCCIRVESTAGGLGATVACAGHEPPRVVCGDGTVRSVHASGSVLGIVEDFRATTASVEVPHSSAIVAVTDGILEARNAQGVFFGAEGYEQVLRWVAGEPATEIGAELERAALAWQQGTAYDDIAVLVARPSRPGA